MKTMKKARLILATLSILFCCASCASASTSTVNTILTPEGIANEAQRMAERNEGLRFVIQGAELLAFPDASYGGTLQTEQWTEPSAGAAEIDKWSFYIELTNGCRLYIYEDGYIYAQDTRMDVPSGYWYQNSEQNFASDLKEYLSGASPFYLDVFPIVVDYDPDWGPW